MTAQLPSKEMLSQTIERITDAIDDVVRLYGEHWDSALVGGEPNYHAITNEQAVVVRTADDSLHSSWLCDYLEAVDPASVRLLLARIKELDKAAHEQEPVAVVEPSDYVTAAQISDDKPRKMAVRELYEGALNVGQNLYTHPAPDPAAHEQEPVVVDGIFKPGDSVGVFNIGNEFCEDHLVAWTVKGQNLPAGIYWLYINPAPVPAAVPDGYVLMPMKLTAENGAKYALSGEFHVLHRVTCHECGGEGCSDCDDEGSFEEKIMIGWDDIKDIYRAAVEACSIKSTGEGV